MALTRKMLKAMGIEEEKIDEIVDAHSETVTALKKERDKYKEDAEKLPDVQKLYDDLKKEVDNREEDEYKEKYEKEHKDFEAFKKSVDAEKTKAKKVEAFKGLLKEAGISEKRIDAITKIPSMDDIELDADGKIKDFDKKVESVKEEYSEFVVTEETKGADTKTPPENNGAGNKTLSRAAEVAKRHNEMLYGVKGEDK